MMGPTHRLFGGLAGVTLATYTDQPWSMVAMSGIVATASAHGWLSPDVDQTKPWVAVRKKLPSFCDQLMNHRTGLSHWWALPALAWWQGIGHLPPDAVWFATVLLVGWVSHLIGDFIFGELALFPWGGPTFGLRLDTGGWIENRLANPLIGAAIVLVLLHAAGQLPDAVPDNLTTTERTHP